MDLTTITVAQFKAQFYRDFPYLPVYDPTVTYNTGNIIYYSTGGLFYQALVNGIVGVTPGTDATKWAVYTTDIMNYVQDQDITNAFAEAQIVFNQALFSTDSQITLGYLYITAHYLANDLKAARGGVNSTGAFPVSSRSVGSVSEAYSIPEAYLANPVFAMYTASSYGLKFLAMALPSMVGNMAAACGRANA